MDNDSLWKELWKKFVIMKYLIYYFLGGSIELHKVELNKMSVE